MSPDGRWGHIFDEEDPRPGGPRVCHYCQSTEVITRDHVIPRHRGGLDTSQNMVWACQTCNEGKANLLPWCRCATCTEAILYHWRHIAICPPWRQRALLAKAHGLPRPGELLNRERP